jgi:hypothetical protein
MRVKAGLSFQAYCAPLHIALHVTSLVKPKEIVGKHAVELMDTDDANLPPTPPPTLEQVLAMQAQMLHTMQQTMVNMHAQPQAPPH